MPAIQFIEDDGGRRKAGFKNEKTAGDCVARAVAIASGRPYIEIYNELAELNANMIMSKHRRKRGAAGQRTASRGIWTKSKAFKDYMAAQGFEWTSTMSIGSGTKVHVRADELPHARLVLRLSNHCAAVVWGVLYDAYDCSRDGTRAVYGYWRYTK
jgi:hypothetical protein